ncbi:hypothetical protein BGX23_007413 [Mortierella sp. AD031]|nr:hypothetical protein BGX23_007413 [Mortierella sp. AD031]
MDLSQIPEIMLQIATHLDVEDFYACLQVCRLWHTVFTPFFWDSIDDDVWPWSKLLKRLSTDRPQPKNANPRADLFRALLLKNRDHVRHLSIHFDSLEIAFDTNFTQLTSLHVFVILWGQNPSSCHYRMTPSMGGTL